MEESFVMRTEEEETLYLPPGFRFKPRDDEIIIHYLVNKVMDPCFSAIAIGEANFNKCEPWDLPKKAKIGEKEWYFFCKRHSKYPSGSRANRATEFGYWKATGKDKEIYNKKKILIGRKKTLVFYKGRAPTGDKSNWVMHEFRLDGKYETSNLAKDAKDEWVVSRIINKTYNEFENTNSISNIERINSTSDDLLKISPLSPLVDHSISIKNMDVHDFKETNISSSNGYYNDPSYLINNENELRINYHVTNQGNFNIPMQIPPMLNEVTDYIVMDQGCNMNNYINYGLENNQCKMEPFSTNNSMVSVSQNTCLSNDIKNETSSVVSKQENIMGSNTNACYEDLEYCHYSFMDPLSSNLDQNQLEFV